MRAGEDILIQAAAGGVGTVAGQVARLAGARHVFGVVGSSEKVEYARGFGYDDVFLSEGWGAAVREATGGRGVDIVLDSIGGAVRAQGFDLLAPLGRLVCFGNACREPEVGVEGSVLRGKVKSTMGWSITALAAVDPQRVRRIAADALAQVAAGSLFVDVTEVFPLDEVAQAHDQLESRRSVGKMVLAVAGA